MDDEEKAKRPKYGGRKAKLPRDVLEKYGGNPILQVRLDPDLMTWVQSQGGSVWLRQHLAQIHAGGNPTSNEADHQDNGEPHDDVQIDAKGRVRIRLSPEVLEWLLTQSGGPTGFLEAAARREMAEVPPEHDPYFEHVCRLVVSAIQEVQKLHGDPAEFAGSVAKRVAQNLYGERYGSERGRKLEARRGEWAERGQQALERLMSSNPDVGRRAAALVDKFPQLVEGVADGKLGIEEAERLAAAAKKEANMARLATRTGVEASGTAVEA